MKTLSYEEIKAVSGGSIPLDLDILAGLEGLGAGFGGFSGLGYVAIGPSFSIMQIGPTGGMGLPADS